MRVKVFSDVTNQRDALVKLAELTQRNVISPLVRETALLIVSECAGRDDFCELQAIFDAVKYGTPKVAALRKGFKYVADPNWADAFVAPHRILEMCARGACGGDCDDHAGLVCALASSIGFRMGLRAYGAKGGPFIHVYAVAATPKRAPHNKVIGMDTTVAQSYLGWEPPPGEILTAWLQ